MIFSKEHLNRTILKIIIIQYMKLSQFKFTLPEELVAKHPTPHRDESRLMVVHKDSDKIEHKEFKDILDYFDEKDFCLL